jgi:hypothetical protein
MNIWDVASYCLVGIIVLLPISLVALYFWLGKEWDYPPIPLPKEKQQPAVVFKPKIEVVYKHSMVETQVFFSALAQLQGDCSIRSLYPLVKRRFGVSKGKLESILDRWEYNPVQEGPYVTLKDRDYALMREPCRGGYRRRLIAVAVLLPKTKEEFEKLKRPILPDESGPTIPPGEPSNGTLSDNPA